MEVSGAAPSPLVTEFAATLPPGRALDLACGAGRHARWLAERGWEVVAIDRTPAPGVLTMDLESGDPLPFPPESFDLVLIIHFLHRPLFAEAKRVTKRGGHIIATIHTEAKHRFLVAPGELRTFFADWTIVHDREGGGVAEVIARNQFPFS
jgi:SAM-dependent methyltransferase